LVVGQGVFVVGEGIALQRGVLLFFDGFLGVMGVVFRRTFADMPAVGVDRDLIVDLAAE